MQATSFSSSDAVSRKRKLMSTLVLRILLMVSTSCSLVMGAFDILNPVTSQQIGEKVSAKAISLLKSAVSSTNRSRGHSVKTHKKEEGL